MPIRMGAAACVLGALGIVAGGGAQAQGGPGKVGFVATERLYGESKRAKAADARIAAEFSGRDKANQAMVASLKKLTDAFEADAPALREPERTRRARELLDLDKEVQRKQTAYRDDLLHRKDEERAQIAERASALIARIAEQENIDIVLFRDVLWTRPGVDITDKIIRQLDQ
ncbi:MAG: OmpH family outer membrane protein [Pseudomonadota bacterium]|nr:OmpH family outer membrane protein [Pseudomonadota bacterium]